MVSPASRTLLSSLTPMSETWLKSLKDDPPYEGVTHQGKFKRDEELTRPEAKK